MITNIINHLASIITETINTTGYFGVFILMALESCGIPAPSEIIMPFAGFLTAIGRFNFWTVSFMGAIGNLFGSLLAYYIGYFGGRPLIEKYGKYILISKRELDIADNWFVRHGNVTVFVGRLLPVIRTYISFPAGIAKMNIKKFSFYTFVGAFIWSALFTYLGIKLQNNWTLIHDKLHYIDYIVVIFIVYLVISYFWKKKMVK